VRFWQLVLSAYAVATIVALIVLAAASLSALVNRRRR
jgi:hypothetical protein